VDTLDQTLIEAQTAIGHQIRSNQPYMYKSGEWGTIVTAARWSDRVVWAIVWPDGARDQWVVGNNTAQYEIVNINEIYQTADDAIDALTYIAGAVRLDDTAPGIRAPRELRNTITGILKDWQRKSDAY
jgi:hypothetical protein